MHPWLQSEAVSHELAVLLKNCECLGSARNSMDCHFWFSSGGFGHIFHSADFPTFDAGLRFSVSIAFLDSNKCWPNLSQLHVHLPAAAAEQLAALPDWHSFHHAWSYYYKSSYLSFDFCLELVVSGCFCFDFEYSNFSQSWWCYFCCWIACRFTSHFCHFYHLTPSIGQCFERCCRFRCSAFARCQSATIALEHHHVDWRYKLNCSCFDWCSACWNSSTIGCHFVSWTLCFVCRNFDLRTFENS